MVGTNWQEQAQGQQFGIQRGYGTRDKTGSQWFGSWAKPLLSQPEHNSRETTPGEPSFTETTCSVFWISLPTPVREKPSARYNQRDLEGGQLLEDHPSHPGLEEFYEAVINTVQAREGQNERSKGLPGMPGCGNGAHSCAYERVTPKKWIWLPSRVERNYVYNCKASCFHHQVLQNRNPGLQKFPITSVGCVCTSSFLSYYLVGKLFSVLLFPCKPRAFFEKQTNSDVMGWAVYQLRQDHNEGKKRNLFALIQVQFSSFTYNKNVIILSLENSWTSLKLYY